MKTNLKRLAFTAMLLSSASVTSADQGANSVGDLAGYGEVAYFHEDATYAENAEIPRASHVGDSMHVGDSHVGDLPSDTPLPESFDADSLQQAPRPSFQPVSFSNHEMSHWGSDCDAGFGCDSGCDSAYAKRHKLFDLFDRCGSDCWATTEALMWFTQDRDMPALISTSDPGTLPILPEGGVDNVQTVFGDDIDGEISGGFRLDYGKYLTESFGVGGRLWWMANNDDSYYAEGDGTAMSIGRPFYNTAVPSNDALLVAFTPEDPQDPTFSGAVAARSELKVWGGEAYARLKLTCNKACRVDLIGGYSHFEIEDMLGISNVTINNDTARIRRFADLFKTDNRFDGGQVGFEMVVKHGRWSARSLTKVHLGNMNQRARIFGISSDQTPPAPINVTSGGLLAMGNQGDYSRDKFAFVPEANFKIGYCLRKNISLTVGYSLIYWDNVALVGDIIDPSVDGTTINTGVFGNRPAFEFNDSSLWVQGVDFGVMIDI